MRKLIQTRLGDDGNCYPTVIACMLDKESPEDVIQIQEHYDDPRWVEKLMRWIAKEGYIMYAITGHDAALEDEFYFVIGNTHRFPDGSVTHVCIYQNGKLFHDPHPDQTGLISEDYFEVIKKI